MKTLKWLWLAALLTIGFKLFNLVIASPNGYSADDMSSFVGLVFAFALISAVLILLWIIGRAKIVLAGKTERS